MIKMKPTNYNRVKQHRDFMMILRHFILIPLIFISLISCSLFESTTESNNIKPSIDKIIIEPDEPTINQLVKLTVFASDADGDELLYKWSVSEGGVNNNGRNNPAYWSTPSTAGNYRITCQVSDNIEIVHRNMNVSILENILTPPKDDD